MNVVVKDTKRKGMGVFAQRNVKKRELIFRYKPGKILTQNDFGKLTEWESRHL